MVGEATIDTVSVAGSRSATGWLTSALLSTFAVVTEVKWFDKQQCYYDGSRSPSDYNHPTKA